MLIRRLLYNPPHFCKLQTFRRSQGMMSAGTVLVGGERAYGFHYIDDLYSLLLFVLWNSLRSRIYLPHIDQHLSCTVDSQYAHGHDVIHPGIRPICVRFELAAKQDTSILESRTFGLHVDVRAIISLEVVSGIWSSDSARIHK
jgi:hypothetical protein